MPVPSRCAFMCAHVYWGIYAPVYVGTYNHAGRHTPRRGHIHTAILPSWQPCGGIVEANAGTAKTKCTSRLAMPEPCDLHSAFFPPGLAETVCGVMRGIAGSLWHGHATDCNPCSGTNQQTMLHHAAWPKTLQKM